MLDKNSMFSTILFPIPSVFVPPLYSTGHIRERYGTNTEQMREKGEVGIKKARSNYGLDTGVPGECYR